MNRIALLSVPVVLAIVGVAWWTADRVPVDGLEAARRSMEGARKARAAEFAPERFRTAEASWRRVLDMMDRASAPVAPLRSYDSVRTQIASTVLAADLARERAHQVSDSLDSVLDTLVGLAETQVERLERAAAFYPSSVVDREGLLEARVLASRRDAARASGDLFDAASLARRHADHVASMAERLDRRLAEIAERVAGWQSMRRDLERADVRPYAVVDKAARTLTIVRRGGSESFDVEFGRDWIGPKRLEGDRATPEGLYRVVDRLGPGRTRYHRALLLDYPNADDRSRFEADRTAGLLPPHARIGGRIELHGGGGRSADWTDGCVALRNDDMERVFALVPVGTPVLIAGALHAPLPHARPVF